jgi:hypothetical protein
MKYPFDCATADLPDSFDQQAEAIGFQAKYLQAAATIGWSGRQISVSSSFGGTSRGLLR